MSERTKTISVYFRLCPFLSISVYFCPFPSLCLTPVLSDCLPISVCLFACLSMWPVHPSIHLLMCPCNSIIMEPQNESISWPLRCQSNERFLKNQRAPIEPYIRIHSRTVQSDKHILSFQAKRKHRKHTVQQNCHRTHDTSVIAYDHLFCVISQCQWDEVNRDL